MHRTAPLTTRRLMAHASKRIPTNNNTRAAVSRLIRLSSTATNSIHETESSAPPSLDEAKAMIVDSALHQVHEHGWTEEAISAGVISSNLPLSMMGMVTPTDLITYFMDDSQEQFQQELDTKYIPMWKNESEETADLSQRLETAIKTRLEYVAPYVKSNRWHEGMALGATSNTTITASQLDRMVQSIANAIVVGTNHAPLGIVERAAIGALYISTELHLLSDDSINHEDTWEFLKSRIGELQLLAQNADWNFVANGHTAVAATAVATSLGGAVVSLLQPAARGAVSAAASTVVPHLATFLQPLQQQPQQAGRDGTRASDYKVGQTTSTAVTSSKN